MAQIALVTGASSGFGQMIATELARAGLTTYASMRDTAGKNAGRVADYAKQSKDEKIDLRSIELDVQDEASCEAAAAKLIAEHGKLDVLVHNAGHMVYGPTEAFTTEQLADQYDVNVLGSHRVNRALLPHMRKAGSGLLVWVSSSSVAGGVPPMLGPYFASKAGMDALAVCYAKELAPLGIDTAIIVPGSYTKGTNHFPHAGHPGDEARAAEYAAAYPDGYADKILAALAATDPEDSDPAEIGRAVAKIVTSPVAKRPFRITIDPASDGSAVSFPVIDRVRAEFVHRIGFPEMLKPKS